ncbi:MAG: 3-hydroxybutyryl-CoA dehydrogenase, partial [Methylobacterium sp.]|nr:3-hydroxybutyryl-CoA dehydrogenase [Methylobacterium sp.]
MAGGISKIGIIGAGQMGSGIAHVAALSGYGVMLHDVSEERIQSGLATINGNMARQVAKATISEEARQGALRRILAANDAADLGDCDLVIEAATENEEVKRKIFASVTRHLKSDAIVASNTSSISITRLASSTDRPDRK